MLLGDLLGPVPGVPAGGRPRDSDYPQVQGPFGEWRSWMGSEGMLLGYSLQKWLGLCATAAGGWQGFFVVFLFFFFY